MDPETLEIGFRKGEISRKPRPSQSLNIKVAQTPPNHGFPCQINQTTIYLYFQYKSNTYYSSYYYKKICIRENLLPYLGILGGGPKMP